MPDSIEILYQDASLVAVNKPPRCESIVKGTKGMCLTRTVSKQLATKLQPAHRLDRDTTGVQLFAKSTEVLREMETLFRHRKVQKEYLALCLGTPRNEEGTICRNLSKWGGGRRAVTVVKGKGGLEAETHYRCLKSVREVFDKDGTPTLWAASLLLFRPHQGRTHQIRVHAQALGYPILGDDQYGDRPANRHIKNTVDLRRQALHAWHLTLPHPDTGNAISFSAPLFEDMTRALDRWMPNWKSALPEC